MAGGGSGGPLPGSPVKLTPPLCHTPARLGLPSAVRFIDEDDAEDWACALDEAPASAIRIAPTLTTECTFFITGLLFHRQSPDERPRPTSNDYRLLSIRPKKDLLSVGQRDFP